YLAEAVVIDDIEPVVAIPVLDERVADHIRLAIDDEPDRTLRSGAETLQECAADLRVRQLDIVIPEQDRELPSIGHKPGERIENDRIGAVTGDLAEARCRDRRRSL